MKNNCEQLKAISFKGNRYQFGMPKSLSMLGLIMALWLALLSMPTWANSEQMAPVVLDGRQIFQVSSSEPFSAQERADWINSQLRAVVESQKPPEVEVKQRNQSPILRINEHYLLTVTQQDVVLGNTPEEQAQIWIGQIRQAVNQAYQERSSQFLWQTSMLVVGIVLLAIALHWGLGRMWRFLLRKAPHLLGLEKSDRKLEENQSQPLKICLNLILLLARTTLWVAVVLYATNLFPVTRKWSYDVASTLMASFTSPILSLGKNSYSLTDLLILICLLLGLVIFAGTVANILESRILSATRMSRSTQKAIAIFAKYVLISIGAIVLLQVWGLELSSLTILASALSVGIGFGFQDIAKNFGSGLVLMFERPIKMGDFVEVGELMGVVKRIGGRSTEIRTLDEVSIIVPNSRFLETDVINWSHHNPISRIHLPVGVAYNSDVNTVRLALIEATKDHPEILPTPQPQVWFKGFGDSALEFELLVWIAQPSKHLRIKSDIYFRIEEALRRHKIEIPFPQQDLHLRSGTLPMELPPKLEQALVQLSKSLTNGKGMDSDN